MLTADEKNYSHKQFTDTGLNVSDDLVRLLKEKDIPLHWIFGSPGLYSRRITLTRFLAQYELFKLVKDIPGSIVECGVFQGNGLLSYAKFLEIFCPADRWRKVFGFDTFKGFSKLAPEDGAKETSETGASKFGEKFSGGYSSESFKPILDELIAIYHKDQFVPHAARVTIYEGDVAETIPAFVTENPGQRIALLVLDMDLYEPTKVALELLYDRVAPGGVVVLDEYANEKWPGESKAFEEFFGENAPRLNKFNWSATPGAWFVKP